MILCIEVYIVQLGSTSKNEEINGLQNIILKEGVTGRAGVLMSNIKVCTDQLYILHNIFATAKIIVKSPLIINIYGPLMVQLFVKTKSSTHKRPTDRGSKVPGGSVMISCTKLTWSIVCHKELRWRGHFHSVSH